MVLWFEVKLSGDNRRESFINMISVVGNLDYEQAEKYYGEYTHKSHWHRIKIGNMIRKQYHRIVYSDRVGDTFLEGINTAKPYPDFPATKYIYPPDNLVKKDEGDIKKGIEDDEYKIEETEMTEQEIYEFYEESEFNDSDYLEDLK